MEQELGQIKQDIGYIKKFIEEDRLAYKEHLVSAQIFRDRVIRLEETTKAHTQEHIYYRWLFGIIISVGLALLVK